MLKINSCCRMPIIPVVPMLYGLLANVSECYYVTFNIEFSGAKPSTGLLDDMCTEPHCGTHSTCGCSTPHFMGSRMSFRHD